LIVAFIIIIHAEICTGAFEPVGKIACDVNALCYEDDGAFTCVCKDTYIGDGWAAGSGCIEGLSQDMPDSGKEESRHMIESSLFFCVFLIIILTPKI